MEKRPKKENTMSRLQEKLIETLKASPIVERIIYLGKYPSNKKAKMYNYLVLFNEAFGDFKKDMHHFLEIAKKLEKSKKDDLVLLCGNRAPVAMVVAIWMQLHGSINVLIYNPKKGGYEIKSDFGSITSKAKRAK